jgi:hypothetical protein
MFMNFIPYISYSSSHTKLCLNIFPFSSTVLVISIITEVKYK